ncbi:MAG: hypothetical protein ACK5V3_10985 [Bdellovibrionales bacterium]
MNKILILLFLYFSYQIPSWANKACFNEVSINKRPEANYKQLDISKFLEAHQILPERIINQIQNRVALYSLRGEDMGNALLIHAFAALGPQPSRQRDLLIEKFLKPLFDYYSNEFESFYSKIPPAVVRKVPNFFGLSKLGFTADAYGNINWSKENSLKFHNLMKKEFSKKMGFDLISANRMVIQMSLIHTARSGQLKMSLSEIKKASDDYFYAEALGHVFIPTLGEWNLSNIVAQWHLRATVNMLPQQLSTRTMVHGGDGLSALDGITHDHGHVVRWRMGVVAESLGIKKNQLPGDSKIKTYEKIILSAFDQALVAHKRSPDLNINPEILTHVLFFFVHQPESLVEFLDNPKLFQEISKAHELSNKMWNLYDNNRNFYPMIVASKEVFERTSSYWIRLLALHL